MTAGGGSSSCRRRSRRSAERPGSSCRRTAASQGSSGAAVQPAGRRRACARLARSRRLRARGRARAGAPSPGRSSGSATGRRRAAAGAGAGGRPRVDPRREQRPLDRRDRRVLVAGRRVHLAHLHPWIGDREQHVCVRAELLDDLDVHVDARKRRVRERRRPRMPRAECPAITRPSTPHPLRAAGSRSRRTGAGRPRSRPRRGSWQESR